MPSDSLGFVLLFIAFVALAVGLVNLRKAKKLLSAPFKKTGEISMLGQSPDPSGAISTEGNVIVNEPLTAPCSGRPCVYFEVEVERMWQKTEMTENGAKTSKGTSNVVTEKQGGVFYLDDGSGAATIDARAKASANERKDLIQSFEQVQNVVAGDVYFGQFKSNVPYDTTSGRSTIGVKCTERILTADGSLFVLGKLQGNAITTSDGMLGKLMLSRKGRDALVGKAQKWQKVGLIAAAVSALPGLIIAIFGDHTRAPIALDQIKDITADAYTSRIYSKSGKSVAWEVTTAGKYEVAVKGTGTSKTYRLWPELNLVQNGTDLAHRSSTDVTKMVACVAPGTYSLDVKDTSGFEASGGQGFEVTVKKAAESAQCDGTDNRPALTQAKLATQPAPRPVAAAAAVGAAVGAAKAAAPSAGAPGNGASAAPAGQSSAEPTAAAGDAGTKAATTANLVGSPNAASAPAAAPAASASASATPAPKPPVKSVKAKGAKH